MWSNIDILIHMKAAQFMLSDEEIRALTRSAKSLKLSRSEIVRRALRMFLEEQRTRALEAKVIRAYETTPQRQSDAGPWEAIQTWPKH